MSKKINLTISNDAKIFVETDGYKGESCVDDIKELLSAFVEIDDFELKEEFYEQEELININKEIKL